MRLISNILSAVGLKVGLREDAKGSNEAETLRDKRRRRYHWVEEEAEQLIGDAYKLHLPHRPFPPSLAFDRKKIETVELPHVPPATFADRLALVVVSLLENLIHLFFWNQYDHHAMTLETVAAVPGMVAGMHRHMRSLRRLARDHGWVDKMIEEATNERMHMLIWLEYTRPTLLERLLVLCAQAVYTVAYSCLYVLSPQTAHRMVGYMEEAAVRSYTDFLEAVDNGVFANEVLANDSIAKKYYRLPEGSTLRDVILHIRADEAFHGLYNHGLSDHISEGRLDEGLIEPGERVLEDQDVPGTTIMTSSLDTIGEEPSELDTIGDEPSSPLLWTSRKSGSPRVSDLGNEFIMVDESS